MSQHRPDVGADDDGLERAAASARSTTRLCQDLPTLVWLANLADIELHPSLSRATAIERPTTLVFDLDPGAPAGIVECCEVALELRELFEQLGLARVREDVRIEGPAGLRAAQRSGRRPTSRPSRSRTPSPTLLEQRHPELVVSSMAKPKRRGKVLIDWSQNDEHKTTVAVYSLRARERPSVSTPVDWKEVEACRDMNAPASLDLQVEEVLRRVRERGDLFAEVVSLRQPLPSLGAA